MKSESKQDNRRIAKMIYPGLRLMKGNLYMDRNKTLVNIMTGDHLTRDQYKTIRSFTDTSIVVIQYKDDVITLCNSNGQRLMDVTLNGTLRALYPVGYMSENGEESYFIFKRKYDYAELIIFNEVEQRIKKHIHPISHYSIHGNNLLIYYFSNDESAETLKFKIKMEEI